MSKPSIDNEDTKAIKAQAYIHHALLLGLQLMVATGKGPDIIEDWMFKLFRRQHLDKFLSSFRNQGWKICTMLLPVRNAARYLMVLAAFPKI